MKKLFVVSQHEQDRAFAQVIGRVAGLAVEAFDSWGACEPQYGAETGPVVLLDVGSEAQLAHVTDQISQKFGLFSSRVDANQFHLISSLDLPDAGYVLKSPLFGNFIWRNFGSAETAGTRYGHLIKASLGGDVFGLSKLLAPGATVQTVVFKSTAQKQEGVEAVRNLLISAKFKSRMATVVANAVDELLMNAMFDACTDERGRQLYAATPRNTVMALDGRQSVELHVGFDGPYVGITAVDQFGSLDKERLVEHLSKGYRNEAYKVKSSVAGAGIGLATVFRSGGSFLFACDAHQRTEVTVFFQRTDSFKEFRDQFRFICTRFAFGA